METLSVKEFEKRVQDFSQKITPEALKGVLFSIGEMIESKIHESFERERDPWGQKWKPLKRNTLKRKRGKGRILHDTGSLGYKWSVSEQGFGVLISSNVRSAKGYPYGAAHQFGARHIPARPFIPVRNGKLEEGLKNDIEAHLKEFFKL